MLMTGPCLQEEDLIETGPAGTSAPKSQQIEGEASNALPQSKSVSQAADADHTEEQGADIAAKGQAGSGLSDFHKLLASFLVRSCYIGHNDTDNGPMMLCVCKISTESAGFECALLWFHACSECMTC